MPFVIGIPRREKAFERIDSLVTTLFNATTTLRNESAAGSITAYRLTIDYLPLLRSLYAEMQIAAATPNLAAYAQSVYDNEGIVGHDPAAEFSAIITAMEQTVANIATLLPKASGKLSIETINLTTGIITPDSYNSAATAGMRTQLDSLLATVEVFQP